MKSTWLLLIAFFCSWAVIAQERIWKNHTVNTGLAGNNIYSIVQDQQQFLWIATENGLSRFDGVRFHNYGTRDGLSDHEIMKVFSDKEGRIWCIGYNGKICYYKMGKFYNAYTDSMIPGNLRTGLVKGHSIDKLGNSWIYGNSLFSFTAHKIIQHPLPYRPINEDAIGYYSSKPGKYYLFFKDIYYEFDSGKMSPRTQIPGKKSHSVKGSACVGSYYALWTSNKDLCVLTVHKNKLKLLKTTRLAFQIKNIIPDKNNAAWILSEGTGFFYCPDIIRMQLGEHFLPEQVVSHVFRDAEGSIWAGTANNGLFCLSLPDLQTLHYNNTLQTRNVHSVCSSDTGVVWIGFDNGKITKLKDGKVKKTYSVIKDSKFCRIKNLKFMHHTLWGGTDKNLLQLKDNGKCRFFSNTGAVKWLNTTRTKNLLLATYAGSYLLHTRSMRFDTLFRKRSTSIVEGKKNEIWIGTLEGLFIHDGKTIHPYRGPGASFCRNSITSLAYAPNHILWVGISDYGVLALTADTFLLFTEANGIEGNTINSIFIDNDNNAWVCSNKGLYKISIHHSSLNGASVISFSHLHEYGLEAVFDVVKKNDSIWVGSSRGLILIVEDSTKKNMHSPPVYITQVLNKQKQKLNSGCKVSYRDDQLQFAFVGVSLRSNGNMYYKYKLEGKEESNWQYTNNGQLEYGSLSAGTYRFIVYARDYFGNWSLQPAIFHFSIQAPFWKSTWFVSLVMVTVMMITGLVVARSQRSRTLKIGYEKKIMQLELEALRAQMNPHFIFNCLNSIQYYIAEQDHQSAQFYLGSFASLIRHTLEYSAQPFILLDTEKEYLENYLLLEKMKFHNHFTYTISDSCHESSNILKLPPMLLQPYVENALRHGLRPLKDRTPYLNINFRIVNQYLQCCIDDNGIGRKKSTQPENRKHTSLGMGLTRQRIETLNSLYSAKIILEIIDKTMSTHGEAGTRVNIFIPLNYA